MRNLRRIPVALLALLALLLAAPVARAQTLAERLEKKLERRFARNAAWVLDYDQARKQAQESGQVIFAYFTRSYAP